MNISVNIFDIVVLAIMLFCIYACYKKGLVRAVYDLFSTIIALIISNSLYPIVSKFLRQSEGVYDMLKGYIASSMGLEQVMKEQTLKAQTELISSFSLPDYFSKLLLTNNNPELYKILNVSTVEDYIAGYIANICVNILSMILVFLVVMFLMRLISQSLQIVSKLPVIGSFNRLGGALAGFVQGTLIIWIAVLILSFFLFKPANAVLLQTFQASRIAIKFYENNILLDMISKIAL